MRKPPGNDKPGTCDVCGRTMLKGERTEPYLAPSRERRLVCDLCAPRAQQEGWIRESADPATPARPQRAGERRRGLFRRRRGVEPEGPAAPEESGADRPRPEVGPREATREPVEDSAAEAEGAGERRPARRGRAGRTPRHVHAVPTDSQLKCQRAIELFNESEHPRTVTGVARALGAPQVSVVTSRSADAEVLLTVVWDLSWYQFAVDLSDAGEAVQMRGRGDAVDELPTEVREWNAHARSDGGIMLGEPESPNGEGGGEVL